MPEGENFMHVQTRPLWTNWSLHLHVGWGRRRNQLCKIIWKSFKGFWSCHTPKNGIFHRLRSSPLQHLGRRLEFWKCQEEKNQYTRRILELHDIDYWKMQRTDCYQTLQGSTKKLVSATGLQSVACNIQSVVTNLRLNGVRQQNIVAHWNVLSNCNIINTLHLNDYWNKLNFIYMCRKLTPSLMTVDKSVQLHSTPYLAIQLVV